MDGKMRGGNKRRTLRQAQGGHPSSDVQSPRGHGPFSRVSNNWSIVFCSTGTILRRKSNGRGSEVESQKVECPEKSEELKRPQDLRIKRTRALGSGGKRRVAHPFQNRKGRPPKRLLRIGCATRHTLPFKEWGGVLISCNALMCVVFIA
jgi:hypothetical protein